MQIADNANSEFQQFMQAVSAVERSFDFIVIDTSGSDSYLMQLAHSSVTGESHYSEMVCDVRRKRRRLDDASADWIVVRNGLSMIGSGNRLRAG